MVKPSKAHGELIYLGMTCFTAPTHCFQVFYMCMFQRCCARFRNVVHVSEMLCTFPSFTDVVHMSRKLCTFHKPPDNVRVQMYTHRAHSNQQKHWGDQTRSPDMSIYTYIYIYTNIHQQHLETKCGEFIDRRANDGNALTTTEAS